MAEDNKIEVVIEFNRPISDDDGREFIRLLDIELGHTLENERWLAKADPGNPGRGWGMGTALVTDVKVK